MSHDTEVLITKIINIQTELWPVRNAAKGMSTLDKKFD